MALPVARISDVCGGRILTGSPSVYVNGLPMAKIGSKIEPHPYGDRVHVAEIITGSSSVYVDGVPMALMGSVASCSVHRVETGSPDVYGGQ